MIKTAIKSRQTTPPDIPSPRMRSICLDIG